MCTCVVHQFCKMYNAPVMKDLFFGVMPVSNTQWSYIWEMRDGLYIFTNHKRQQ